jgi:PAS domain S-box-containing protein
LTNCRSAASAGVHALISKRFDALLLASASIVWWTNATGEFAEEQPYWHEYTGQTFDEYRGSRWTSVLHPDDREHIIADWADAIASGGPYFTQGRIWSAKHGAYRAFQTRGIAIRNQEGDIVEWLGALTDVQDTIDIKTLLDRAQVDLAKSLQARRMSEAQLRDREARSAKDAAALRRLNAANARLWQAQDLSAGLNKMLVATVELLGGDMGNIQLLDTTKGALVIAAQKGFQQPFLDVFKEVSADDGSACGRALRTGERIIVEDIDADEGFAPYRAAAHAAGYRAVQSTPLIGRHGKRLGMLSTHFRNVHRSTEHELQLLDIYARRAADFIEHVRSDEALRQSEERYRGVYNNAGTGIYIADLNGRYRYCNPAYASVHGYTEDELRTLNMKDVVYPEDWPPHAPQVQQLISGKVPSFEIVNRCVTKRGELLWMHKHVSLLRDAAGRPESIIALVTNVTERKKNEECIALLMREVNHRSKNLLMLVQAIARQTNAPEDFLHHFDERIHALAAGDDLLVKNEWKGVNFEDLARSQIAHVIDPTGARIRLSGPPILVSASAAQTLGMALHELATNAGKYGALSNYTGQVELSWDKGDGSPSGGLFTLGWRESGGPLVTEPSHSGFGSSVICSMVEYNLDANVDLNFLPSGLEWRIQCALASIIGSKGPTFNAKPRFGGNGKVRSGPARILVVEDEALVAVEISRILREQGFQIVGPTARVEEALHLLNEVGCDAAVLDIQLGRETSELIASVLAARDTPFVAVSGYSRGQRPRGFQNVAFLAKPLRSELLVEHVKRCLDSRTRESNARSAPA